jgi:hypothetical protein
MKVAVLLLRAPRPGECSHALWRFCGGGALPRSDLQRDQGAATEGLKQAARFEKN